MKDCSLHVVYSSKKQNLILDMVNKLILNWKEIRD